MIDLDQLLAPIPGNNPSGESLRYTPVYDTLKEARREDEELEQGEWQHELKRADWDVVVREGTEALINHSKDLQIAAWLTEALIEKHGFSGLEKGLQLICGLLENFWESLYPEIDDGDLDFRAAPLEFMNSSFPLRIRKLPLTDPKAGAGYSWAQREASRQVGYEASAKDPNLRKEMIAEGKLTPEEFDKAVAASSDDFYRKLSSHIAACAAQFERLDRLVDDRFPSDAAPKISDISEAIFDCQKLVGDVLKQRGAEKPDTAEESPPEKAVGRTRADADSADRRASGQESTPEPRHGAAQAEGKAIPLIPLNKLSDSGVLEEAIWADARKTLESDGLKKALEELMSAAYRAPSVREKNRYRLMIAKLCLKGERPDLARPFIEQLHALIEELGLERWESPVWIGEVLDTYYQVLTWGEPGSSDEEKAYELLRRLCTIDITKAIKYRM